MSDGLKTQVKAETYGTLADGGVVTKYTLTSAEVELELISYGRACGGVEDEGSRRGFGAISRWGMAS